MRTDLHQHLLPEELIAALARRTAPPRLVPDGPILHLELAGEPPSTFDPTDHDPAARAAAGDADRIVVSLSTALGIEALPPGEAEPLLEAYNRGILGLGAPFELWGAAVRPQAVDALLDAGALGLTLPARSLAGEHALTRVAPLLDRLEARDAPLFVHPGPAAVAADAPAWWPALTDYVAQMSAAWHAFAAWGRPRHPRLRVVFAMLAGCGPLHAERFAARGGPAEAIHDPLVWFDSSSYGARTLDSMLRMVGVDRLVHGSDLPVIEASAPRLLGDAVEHAMTVVNPERALGPITVPA
jgi:6-methylsalicylate decarboxylase